MIIKKKYIYISNNAPGSPDKDTPLTCSSYITVYVYNIDYMYGHVLWNNIEFKV